MAIDALEEVPDPITGEPTWPHLDMALQPTGTRPHTDSRGRTVPDAVGAPMLLDVEATVTGSDGVVRRVSEIAADEEPPAP